MATAVKDLTVDDLREIIEQTVQRTLDDYLDHLRLLLPVGLRSMEREERDDPQPPADRALKPSLDH